MARSIQTLPSEVVHLIAAGEVIDSLASVVRELVENSLDAGATRIVVFIWSQQWRVRVADNGCGMGLEDLEQAATSHSTSKIKSCADLWKINSLGFRGEALHSLTTLADVEILSRKPTPPLEIGEVNGWRVVYNNLGEAAYVEVAAIAPGTVVTVSNLFGNWLARRQGMPTNAQQMKAVQAAIHQIALCHPHITWQVWQNDRQWFTISPSSKIAQLLPQILHQVRESDLQESKVEVSNPKNSLLQLVLGLPDRCHRHRPDWVRLAVNGRMVKCPELEHTILSAFHRTLPRDRYPICFLHLFISPNQINWNRNPAKTQIYLNELQLWQEQISLAIDQTLRINPTTIKEAVYTTRVGKLFQAAEEKAPYKLNYSVASAQKGSYNFNNSNPSPENQPPKSPSQGVYNLGHINTTPTLPNFLKAVGQVNNTYIVAEHPGGVWLVEQHIAHERVLYEQLRDSWRLVAVEPVIILYQLSPSQISQLQRIGLEIEPFGEELWAVRNLPALLQQREDCAEAILELSWGGDLQAAQVAVACRSAIRNGTPLNLQQMQTLLDQWQSTRHPLTCPHGRPIHLPLEESSLSKYFRRHWVIGKSHGV